MIKKYCLILLLLIMSSFLAPISAHSVQVAYCVSCNGNLRIFFEHWHGFESINSTTMTISLTVNSVTTTQTTAPQGAVYSTTLANLPGCSTPIIVAAACPGQANNYNDWIFFDYFGLPCGVPISFTIISGNTVFTTDGCGMFPLTVPFTIPCNSNFLSNINVCDGVTTSPIVVPPNTVWTNSNPAIGLPAFGVGNIPSFTPIGPTSSAVISYVSACVNSTFNIYVTPNPTASFSATNVCEGTATTFNNQSALNFIYSWNFGDNTTSSLQNPPPHTYALPGIYTVTLVVSDNGNCTATATQQVTVWPLPQVAFTAPSVCIGGTTPFTNQSTISSGNIISWSWNFGNPIVTNDVSSLQNPTYLYTTSGTFNVTLICTSSNGCVSLITVPVFVNTLPSANFNAISSCLGTSTIFNDLSVPTTGVVTNWVWDFGDGSPVSTQQNPSHTYLNDSTFNVSLIVTNTAGCTDTFNLPVTINPLPIVAFSSDTFAGCPSLCVNFINQSSIATTGNIVGWSWDFGDSSAASTLQSPSHCYNLNGLFTVTLSAISNGGCITTFVIPNMITVYPSPIASFTATPYVTSITSPIIFFTDLSQGNPITWQWNFGDINLLSDTSIIPSPQYTYTSAVGSVYNVTLMVSNQYGCSDDTTIQITIESDFNFHIPNAFTPNGDGINDVFFGYGYGGITEYQIWIFDRWGILMFTSVDVNEAWDGTYNNQPLPIDVYVWKVSLYALDKFNNNKKHILVGTVTIIK